MSTGRFRTQGLTEGAVLAALVALLAAASRYVPLVGAAAAFVAPLPLTVLVLRQGLRIAAVAGLASALVAMAIAGPLVGLGILISVAPTGLVLGLGVRRGWPALRTVLMGGGVAFVSMVLNYMGLLGVRPMRMSEMAQSLDRSLQMSAGIYARLGIPAAQTEVALQPMREVARFLPYMLPAILAGGALVAAWINYEVGRRVLRRFGYQLTPLPPARTWRVPAAGIWIAVLGYVALSVAGARWPEVLASRLGSPGSSSGGIQSTTTPPLQPGARTGVQAPVTHAVGATGTQPQVGEIVVSLALSLWLAAQCVFLLQGLFAGWVILGNYGYGRLAQWLAVAVAMTTPFLGGVVFLLGVLDSAWKVRERWGIPRPSASGAGS